MKILNRILATALLCASAAGEVSAECSPIVIDLGNNGISLGEAGVGVYFDINADGVRDHVQWVRSGGDEGFLALDRNGNGVVDDGSELFGVGTPLILEGRTAPNGFVGLAQYDSRQLGGNDDGLITEADAIWPQLRIWVDANADGVSTYSEMRTLTSYGITALETIPRIHKYVDRGWQCHPLLGLGHAARHVPGACSWSTCSSASCPRCQGPSRRTSATRVSTSSLRKIWRACDLMVLMLTPRRRGNLRERPPIAQVFGDRVLAPGQARDMILRSCITQVSTELAVASRGSKPDRRRRRHALRLSRVARRRACDRSAAAARQCAVVGAAHRARSGAARAASVAGSWRPACRLVPRVSLGLTLLYMPESGRYSPGSARESLHPGGVLVHPAVQELARLRIRDIAGLIEEAFLHLDIGLGLSQGRHVEVGQDGAQVELRHRRTDGARAKRR